MQVKISGTVVSVTNEVSKTTGKTYRSFQLLQTGKTGKQSLVSCRCFDPALKLDLGKSLEVEGLVDAYVSGGRAGLSFSVFAPQGAK